jgi:hypothetical protein
LRVVLRKPSPQPVTGVSDVIVCEVEIEAHLLRQLTAQQLSNLQPGRKPVVSLSVQLLQKVETTRWSPEEVVWTDAS